LLRERRCVAEHACVAPNVKSESAPFRGDPIADASMRSESSASRQVVAVVPVAAETVEPDTTDFGEQAPSRGWAGRSERGSSSASSSSSERGSTGWAETRVRSCCTKEVAVRKSSFWKQAKETASVSESGEKVPSFSEGAIIRLGGGNGALSLAPSPPATSGGPETTASTYQAPHAALGASYAIAGTAAEKIAARQPTALVRADSIGLDLTAGGCWAALPPPCAQLTAAVATAAAETAESTYFAAHVSLASPSPEEWPEEWPLRVEAAPNSAASSGAASGRALQQHQM